MQFSIDKDTFQQAIQAVQRATATRVIQPILANILIESVASDRLKLSATDLDFAIEAIVPAMILTPGRTTVSGCKLAEILAKLPTTAPLQATLDPATQQLHLTSGKAKFDIRTMSADEFPTIRQIDNASALNVNLKTLLRVFSKPPLPPLATRPTCWAACIFNSAPKAWRWRQRMDRAWPNG